MAQGGILGTRTPKKKDGELEKRGPSEVFLEM